VTIRIVDDSSQRSGVVVGALLMFLLVAWNVIGAQPEDSQQERPSSQPPAGQTSETDRLAAEQAAQLEALGYLQGSVKATVAGGVSKYDPTKSFEGLNLYISGHSPSAILMDMEGNVLHVWHYPFENAWKDYPGKLNVDHKSFWRRVHLYQNGDLLAIFEGLGMIKLDRNSKLLWTSGFKQHHDLDVHENGDIYVLTRMGALIPRINKRKPVIEDSITILGPDGWGKRRFSLIEALERYPEYALYWNRAKQKMGDIFHTNSLEILDGSAAHKNPAFAKGNVLISMRSLDAVFVVDPKAEQVVWAYSDDFEQPHDAQVLPNGNLLLFDNLGGSPKRGSSRMLEYRLPDMDLVWTYEGTPWDHFFSKGSGMAQRLPNQNTLITETDTGRAFEVTPKGKIVWQFINPHHTGPDNTYVASLFALHRIAREDVSWLKIERPEQ